MSIGYSSKVSTTMVANAFGGSYVLPALSVDAYNYCYRSCVVGAAGAAAAAVTVSLTALKFLLCPC